MSNTTSPRPLLEGALLAGISAILAFIGTYLPIAGTLAFFVVAVPIIVAIVRNNLFTGVLASITAFLLVSFLAGPIVGVGFYLQFMILALVYGVMFKNKKSAGKILGAGTIIAIATMVLNIFLIMVIGQIDLAEQKEVIYQSIDQVIRIYEESGLLEQYESQGISKEELRRIMTLMVNSFLSVLPSVLLVGSVFTAFVNFLVARSVLNKLGYKSPGFPPFSQWRVSWYVIWGLIIGWGSYLLGDIYQMNFFTIAGKNIMIGYSLLLLVLGLSVISFYFKKFKLTTFSRLLLITVGVLMFHIAALIIMFIGMFDLVLDFRKLSSDGKSS